MSLRERAFGLRFGFGTLASRIRYRNSLACRCRWSSSLSTGGVYESPTGNHNDVDSLILNIPKSNVYRFGDANHVSTPVFRDLEWRIREGEAWAVVGSAGNEKSVLLQTLLGYTRISPSPPGGIYPFLTQTNPPRDPHSGCISLVSFTTNRRGAAGGAFYDYTARYGAVRDEDRVTLREVLFAEYENPTSKDGSTELDILAERLDLVKLLDLPMVVLSNGQTRRARIARALLGHPEVLLLDEPLTGLDVQHRPKLTRLLGEIHLSRRPRVIMALRPQDPVPEWVTHVARIEGGGRVRTGKKRELWQPYVAGGEQRNENEELGGKTSERVAGKVLVDMKNVNVKYSDRHVLKDVNWTIREGDRWHLKGPNGSGKTTLLSLITGDHPQSYTQGTRSPSNQDSTTDPSSNASHLELFSRPRRALATTTLSRLIGIFSPELYAAFPRRLGSNALTVRDTIATGFEGTFSYRPCTEEMNTRIDELLTELGPDKWSSVDHTVKYGRTFSECEFAMLSSGEQGLVLLLRALVGKPPLLILDEVFAGMDAKMIDVAKEYLSRRLDSSQAVIFVTHWEEEVPWKGSDLQSARIEDGQVWIS